MIPLIPSPGSPKTTSTPQSINPSMSTSAAVMADTFPVNICAQLRCAPSESRQHKFSAFFSSFWLPFRINETLLDPETSQQRRVQDAPRQTEWGRSEDVG